MAPFKALYIRRSDGQLETALKAKRTEPNQPTAEQLDQKPDKDGVSDFYREVLLTEPKHLDWRRKLGGMLAKQLDLNTAADRAAAAGPDPAGYILAALPANYRLYEHVKKTEVNGQLEVKSKTHAAGGNDRKDAYLYGHPMGRKKRYRSPADFFPHLLWLGTDESGDVDNCSCKLCCPEDLESLGLATAKGKGAERGGPASAAVSAKAGGALPPTTTTAAPPLSTSVKQQIAAPGSKSEADTNKTPSGAPTSTRAAPPTVAPPRLLPTPLPQPRLQDQVYDSHYGMFMYRPGELVWFKRGQPWGLGVILRRWCTAPPHQQFHYAVQPLSYPGHQTTAVVKSSDAELRPWLAWSVPQFTNAELNTLQPSPRYDTADWPGIANRRYGAGDIEVDASILAAKAIDASCTLLHPRHTAQPEPAVFETHYDAAFLGAEKIWVGEPVRLHLGSGTNIMVVHSIIDRRRNTTTAAASTPSQPPPPQHQTLLQGDVYSLATAAHTDPSRPSPASPANNPHLPARLTQDLAARNGPAIPAKGQVAHWKLVSSQARVAAAEVKGRWYEASLLLPILQPAAYAAALGKGEVQEASLWMNARGDCAGTTNSSSRPGQAPPAREIQLMETRLAALGPAVPPGTVIRDGVDPPSAAPPASGGSSTTTTAMEIDPRFGIGGSGSDGHADSRNSQSDANNLDAFVNLDEMEGVASGDFAQQAGGAWR